MLCLIMYLQYIINNSFQGDGGHILFRFASSEPKFGYANQSIEYHCLCDACLAKSLLHSYRV